MAIYIHNRNSDVVLVPSNSVPLQRFFIAFLHLNFFFHFFQKENIDFQYHQSTDLSSQSYTTHETVSKLLCPNLLAVQGTLKSLLQYHSLKTSILRPSALFMDCKEIKLVNPKENQSWIFIGRTDDEAETPILWPPDVKNWLIGKDPDAEKDWRQEDKGKAGG